jgi:hypothetical protein
MRRLLKLPLNPDKTEGIKSHSVSPEQAINEVIQSIESVDRKIRHFYEIHGAELQIPNKNRPTFRRLK